MGMKPIVEIMWGDFMLVALDQIINQAANVRYITAAAPVRRLSFAPSRERHLVRAPDTHDASKRFLPIFRD